MSRARQQAQEREIVENELEKARDHAAKVGTDPRTDQILQPIALELPPAMNITPEQRAVSMLTIGPHTADMQERRARFAKLLQNPTVENFLAFQEITLGIRERLWQINMPHAAIGIGDDITEKPHGLIEIQNEELDQILKQVGASFRTSEIIRAIEMHKHDPQELNKMIEELGRPEIRESLSPPESRFKNKEQLILFLGNAAPGDEEGFSRICASAKREAPLLFDQLLPGDWGKIQETRHLLSRGKISRITAGVQATVSSWKNMLSQISPFKEKQ